MTSVNFEYNSQHFNEIPRQWILNVTSFFNEERLNILHDINYKSPPFRRLSLRKINFFVIVHSKLFDTHLDDDQSIYQAYLTQLKLWRRKYFDPFRRGIFVMQYTRKDQKFWTTFPQLNFFSWFIQNGIMEYMMKNLDQLNISMSSLTKSHRLKKQEQNSTGHKKRVMFEKKDKIFQVSKSKETFSFTDDLSSTSSRTHSRNQ